MLSGVQSRHPNGLFWAPSDLQQNSGIRWKPEKYLGENWKRSFENNDWRQCAQIVMLNRILLTISRVRKEYENITWAICTVTKISVLHFLPLGNVNYPIKSQKCWLVEIKWLQCWWASIFVLQAPGYISNQRQQSEYWNFLVLMKTFRFQHKAFFEKVLGISENTNRCRNYIVYHRLMKTTNSISFYI